MTHTPDPSDDRPEPTSPSQETTAPAFDRAISPIAGRLSGGRAGKGLVVLALVAGCGVFVAATWGRDGSPPAREPNEPARQVVPFEPIDRNAAPTLTAPGPDAPTLGPAADGPQVPAIDPSAAHTGAPIDAAAQRRAELSAIRGAPILAYSRSSGTGGQGIATVASSLQDSAAGAAVVADPTELDELREALPLEWPGRGACRTAIS